jgi:hypothetical protein
MGDGTVAEYAAGSSKPAASPSSKMHLPLCVADLIYSLDWNVKMDIARCVESGLIYTGNDFARLDPINLERMRRLLQCPECNGPGYFRKSSRNRGAPCFGARHADGCRLTVPNFDRLDDRADEERYRAELMNPGNRIVVDFDYGAHDRPEWIDGANCAQSRTRASYMHGTDGGGRQDVRVHRRLSSLLRTLINAPAFGQSDVIMEVAECGEIAARDFFVPILDVTVQYAGQFRGYWGLLSDARYHSDQQLWLNGGGRNHVSFCVQRHHVDEIVQRYRISDEEDFAGAYVLVTGMLQISRQGKRYCVIADPRCIALKFT